MAAGRSTTPRNHRRARRSFARVGAPAEHGMGIAPEPRAIAIVCGNTNHPRSRSMPGKLARLGSRDEIVLEEELCFESQLMVHSGLAEHVIGIQADKFHVGAGFLEFVVERLGLSDRNLLVVRAMNDE